MALSPHPHIPALHSRKRDSSPQNLSDWATSILAFHQSPEAVLEWQIQSVQWFKVKSGLEHEYPIFTLRNESDPNTKIYLRFDRRSSAEVLESKGKDIVIDRKRYDVRSLFYNLFITISCESFTSSELNGEGA